MTTRRQWLAVEELSAAAFAPFGEVIDPRPEAAQTFAINEGYTTRLHALARVDVADRGGAPIISIFRSRARVFPMQLRVMERHPLGSQAFMPLAAFPYLVVVAPPGAPLDLGQLRCFLVPPGYGVNFAKGTWHHPQIAVAEPSDFLVVDRGGAPGDPNLDEVDVLQADTWIQLPADRP
jgi:ureidoglycolate lyase